MGEEGHCKACRPSGSAWALGLSPVWALRRCGRGRHRAVLCMQATGEGLNAIESVCTQNAGGNAWHARKRATIAWAKPAV